MSDSTPSSPTGTGPVPTPFSPSDASGAPELRPEGAVVLLLAGAEDSSWAAESAISLASAWSRSGRRVVLADLHLENPTLHERLGVANLEGMVDVFLYGASISRSARPVRGRGFYLITSGTYEPDADAIHRHSRWPKLIAGFREANASLVLFAPAESTDLHALSRWVDRVVLLGAAPPAGSLDPLLDRGVPVDAHLVPPGAIPPPDRPAEPELPLEAVHAAPRFEDEELRIPPPPPREEPRSGRRGWIVALLVLAAAAALGWLGYAYAGGQAALSGRAAPGADGADALSPAAAPTRAGEALPFSVQVKAFSSFAAAQQDLLAQTSRSASLPFFVSPEEVQGVLYFKVMAGLAADTAAANALQARLVEAAVIEPEDAVGTWSLIRPTPFAFDLGEFATPREAGARSDSLLERDLPSYAVAMPYSDRSRRWRLYAGAYPDSASAEAMRQRLQAAGVESRLVLRIGEPGVGGAVAVR